MQHISGFLQKLDTVPPRSLAVLELLGMGLSVKEVASQLGISVSAVNAHKAKISQRLGTARRADYVKIKRHLDVQRSIAAGTSPRLGSTAPAPATMHRDIPATVPAEALGSFGMAALYIGLAAACLASLDGQASETESEYT